MTIQNAINQAKEVTALLKCNHILRVDKTRACTLFTENELTKSQIRRMASDYTIIYFYYIRKQVVMVYENEQRESRCF